jgi:hypothetical protein
VPPAPQSDRLVSRRDVAAEVVPIVVSELIESDLYQDDPLRVALEDIIQAQGRALRPIEEPVERPKDRRLSDAVRTYERRDGVELDFDVLETQVVLDMCRSDSHLVALRWNHTIVIRQFRRRNGKGASADDRQRCHGGADRGAPIDSAERLYHQHLRGPLSARRRRPRPVVSATREVWSATAVARYQRHH